MPTAKRSVRQEQRELTAQLRAKHRTWSEVAAVYRERYGVTMRAALRMARDWSQRDAADEWNRRWPNDPKTFKNFSYWELWPGPTGHAPSLDVLGRLAELYECSVADLVSDCADFRSRDPAYRDERQLAQLANDPRELIAQLEVMDVHELARVTSAWFERLGMVANRRSLLPKLSVGLSLAAALPEQIENTSAGNGNTPMVTPRFQGIWRSRYVYPSTGRQADFAGEHYLVLRQEENQLIGQSLPHSNGSRLRMDLTIDQSVASGTWQERTSPHGYYRGASYHGNAQFVIDPSGRTMRGMWIGFGRDFTINSGQWDLQWENESITKTTQRRYRECVSNAGPNRVSQ